LYLALGHDLHLGERARPGLESDVAPVVVTVAVSTSAATLLDTRLEHFDLVHEAGPDVLQIGDHLRAGQRAKT